MPGIIELLRLFKLTALRPNGSGVEGATVRILDAAHLDVTSSFFGTGLPITPVTDSQGLLTKLFLVDTQQLPAGQVYTIQVIADGFSPWSFQTATTFIGAGDFTANLVRPDVLEGYTITEPTTVPASSMIPIITTVVSPNSFTWEYIRCMIEGANGKTSTIEAPVDKLTDRAIIDFRNRIALGTRPLLVPGTDLSREDTDFSTVVGVSFSSLSEEGETPITGDFDSEDFDSGDFGTDPSFTQLVAATLPPDGQTDLSSYVTPTERSWIVPPGPVIAFRGYYRDVMVWLTVPSLPGYVLHTSYIDGSGEEVSSVVQDLTESQYVQRIRLDTDPAAGISKAELFITSGDDLITKTLTVLYRD